MLSAAHLNSRVRKYLWIVPAAFFLLITAGTLSSSSYFLHFDTATQHVAAVDLLRGCWGYTAATFTPMLLIAAGYAAVGINPLVEPVLLSLLGAAMAAAFYRTAERHTRSPRWSMLGALWFMTLPTVLYYTRMHIGYALAFFALGVWLHTERRYLWAGVMLGLALTSHFNYIVPIAAWLGWSFLTDRETRRLRSLGLLIGGLLLPLLVLETARFLFTGVAFGWARSVVEDALRLSDGAGGGDGDGWPVWHILHMMGFANGWGHVAILAAGLGYPFVREKKLSLMDAVFLTGWSLVGFYSLRVSLLHNTFLTPRMFSAAYPLLALTSIYTLGRLARRLDARLNVGVHRLSRAAGALIVVLALPAALLGQSLDALVGSRTAYADAADIASHAVEAGLPVRYFGVYHVGLELGQRYGIDMGINENSVDVIAADTGAVLIFEGTDNPVLEAIRSDPRIDPSDYEIRTYDHRVAYRPAAVEEYGRSPEVLRALARQPYARQPGAEPSTLVVWWPRSPQGEVTLREEHNEYIYRYTGGCVTPRVYGGHKLNYYDLLLDKLNIVWQDIRQGHFRELFQRLWTWLTT